MFNSTVISTDITRKLLIWTGCTTYYKGSEDHRVIRAQGPFAPPVSWDMLKIICNFISTTYSPEDSIMLRAAVLVAYFGMLRISEYTMPSQAHFDPLLHLTVDDVTIIRARKIARIYLKKSKTDPFRKGVAIRIGVLGHDFCPVITLVRYLAIRGPKFGPLFMFSNGIFLTRLHIHDILRKSLPDVPHVNTHSFRSGGATALANAGVPAYAIQILGRWKSRAYATYVQYSDNYIISANRHMSK